MSTTHKTAYEVVATSISDYVQAHLGDEILIDDLARHVGVSKFHLNRLFHAVTGFQLGEFIARRRLQAAYALLAQGNSSVIDVSLAVGYLSHSAFSRAFLNAFGCTPNAVKIGTDCTWRTPNTIKKPRDRDAALQPEIVTLPTQTYRGLYGAGFENSSFVTLGTALFSQLGAVLAQANLSAAYSMPIGVSLDNPWQSDQDQSRFFIGVNGGALPANLPLQDYIWQQGTWAKFHHTGSYGLMWQTISRVVAGWVVPAQIALRDDAIVQMYLNNPRITAEADLLTALYFPIDVVRPLS